MVKIRCTCRLLLLVCIVFCISLQFPVHVSEQSAIINELGRPLIADQDERMTIQSPDQHSHLIKNFDYNNHSTPSPDGHAEQEAVAQFLHIFQYGKARTATTTQFNILCVSLFLHVQINRPELLNNTICNNADKWAGTKPKVEYFLQQNDIPQAVKSHVTEPPTFIKNSTMVFATAFNKSEAAQTKLALNAKRLKVGMVQDLETLREIGISGMVKRYAELFNLTTEHISLMTTYFEHWHKLRQCCGLQMSKYFRNELLPSNKKKTDMKKHEFCGSIDIGKLEAQYMDTEMYNLLNGYKLMRRINRPATVDGDLDGTYCARYNDAVRKHGLTGNLAFSGLNSRYPEVENHFDEEVTPTFEGLEHVIQKQSTDVHAGKQHQKLLSLELTFSPWVKDYIIFHQSSTSDGKLADDARYIIYECMDGAVECGGAGDRIIGMIKMFYLAMCTRRVLLIDAPFPIPLTAVLHPAHINWNASFPNTTEYFPDMIYNPKIPLGLRKETRGYRIRQTNGIPRKKALDDIWQSSLMLEHLKENQWEGLAEKASLADVANEAFRAMFTFSRSIISRANELKKSAGISGSYLGMHMRKGDAKMGVEGPTARKKLKIDRTTDDIMMMSCYHRMKSSHPNAFSVAYLASDDVESKQNMTNSDSSIHFAKEIYPFHVDLLARKGHVAPLKFDSSDPAVFNGVIDSWAEMLILAESSCIIVSQSMFSFGSLYMRDPQGCAVFLHRCDVPAHREGHFGYYGEAIYNRGFVLIESQKS